MINQLLGMIQPLMATAAAEGAHGGGESAGAPELPNIITMLSHQYRDVPFIAFLHHWENVIFAFTVAIGLSVLSYAATKNKSLLPG